MAEVQVAEGTQRACGLRVGSAGPEGPGRSVEELVPNRLLNVLGKDGGKFTSKELAGVRSWGLKNAGQLRNGNEMTVVGMLGM